MRAAFASVRVRISLLAAAVFAVAMTLAGIGLVVAVRTTLVDRIKDADREQVEAIAAQLERGTPPREVELLNPPPGGFPQIVVEGADGRTTVPGLPPGQRRAPGPTGRRVRTETVVETPDGPITVIAQRSLDEVERTVDSVTGALVVGIPILVLLVGAIAWYLSGRALRPVEAIRAEVDAISGTTMHRRVPEPAADDEVGRLARTMNRMLDRLETSSARQREFVSNASHELRSPIAAIRATVEVALRRPDTADWSEIAARILDEDERMEETVSELLELARLDEDGPALPTTTVDIDEVVLEEAGRVDGATVRTGGVLAGRVRGSRPQLARVVRNLIANALRHAENAVDVRLRSDDGTVELVVDDDGPGISPADRERVFERFTRLDEGRARDAGGTGLGLAIVRAVVERHRGTVTIEDAPGDGGGARFVVRLPAAT
ncbi:MAG: sensor histidine kinase [Actinomycetota bacterium]